MRNSCLLRFAFRRWMLDDKVSSMSRSLLGQPTLSSLLRRQGSHQRE